MTTQRQTAASQNLGASPRTKAPEPRRNHQDTNLLTPLLVQYSWRVVVIFWPTALQATLTVTTISRQTDCLELFPVQSQKTSCDDCRGTSSCSKHNSGLNYQQDTSQSFHIHVLTQTAEQPITEQHHSLYALRPQFCNMPFL